MKKEILLIALFVVMTVFNVFCQSLTNTTWSVNEPSGTFLMYFHFGNDTLYESDNSLSYYKISTFQQSGSNISLIDLPPTLCPGITGEYTFTISSDTLKFNLINDLCYGRPKVFCNYRWLNIISGIQHVNILTGIQLYPNPAGNEIFVTSKDNVPGESYVISDQFGRQILTGKLTMETTSIDIKKLSAGLYYIQIGEKSKHMMKVMKK
jgi:hypothetical protein